MSQDESLRLAATVVDGFSGPLKNLRTQMQGLAKEGAGHNETLEKGLGKVAGAMRSAEQAAAAGLNPALKTIGVTSLSTTAAILGVGAAMRSFATGAASLGQMSRDTGIAAQTLRDFGAVAGKFNVTQEQVAQGAQTFADKMRTFSKGHGDLWAWINRQGTSAEGRKHFQDFAADLARTKDTGDQLRKGLQELENIKDPRERRIFAQEFFGNADIARLGDGTLGKFKEIWDKTAGKLGPLDPKAVESAERFERSLADLGSSMRKLGITIGQEVLPYAERFVTWIDGVVSDQRGGAIQAIREGLGGIKKELNGIDWKAAGEDGLAFLRESTALAGTLARSLRTVAEVMRAWREGSWSDVFRATTGGQGTLGKAVRMIDPKAGDDAIQQRAEVEALQRELKAAEYDQETGGPALDFKSREPVLKKRLADAEAELKRMEARSPEQRQKEFEASEKLRQSLDKLGEKVDAARGATGSTGSASQDALLQLQSFGGAATVGAMIHKAGLGGGGSYGAGTLGERLFGRPTGSNALGDPYREKRMQALLGDPSAEWRMRILRGERGVPLPGGGGGNIDIGEGLRGRPFGKPAVAVPGADSPSGRVGRALRGGDSEPPAAGGYSGNDGRRAARNGMTAAGRANVASWMEFFRRPTDQGGMGYTEEQARGQIAMMQGESGLNLNPGAMGDHDRAGVPHAFGTVQWSDAKGNDRFPRLRALAAEMGKDWRDRSVQQEMYRREMMGRYRAVYNRIRGGQTGEQSLWTGITGYENPREHALAYSIRRPFLERLRRDGSGASTAGADRPTAAAEQIGEGLRQVRPWQKVTAGDSGGEAFAADFKRRQAVEGERREGLRLGIGAQSALQAGAGTSQGVLADGRVNINVHTRDPDTKVRTSASGNLFREVVQNRGRQMAASGE